MPKVTVVGQNFCMDGVSVTSRYDRVQKHGYLNLDIEAGSHLDQRRAAAEIIRQFADEIESDRGEVEF